MYIVYESLVPLKGVGLGEFLLYHRDCRLPDKDSGLCR
jgi:hypothetical protein